MKRMSDVDSLIGFCSSEIKLIKDEYVKSLNEQSIDAQLLIKIKSFMEHLRSALDYMANDIWESYNDKPNSRVYFPYGKNEEWFNNSISKSFIKLKENKSEVYNLIEGLQPHKCGDTWLVDFCGVLNQNKHQHLTPQVRTETIRFDVYCPNSDKPVISAPAGSIKAPPGAIRINKTPLIFNKSTGIPNTSPQLPVSTSVWVCFFFNETNIEVLPLLNKTLQNINHFKESLYQLI